MHLFRFFKQLIFQPLPNSLMARSVRYSKFRIILFCTINGLIGRKLLFINPIFDSAVKKDISYLVENNYSTITVRSDRGYFRRFKQLLLDREEESSKNGCQNGQTRFQRSFILTIFCHYWRGDSESKIKVYHNASFY